MDLYRIEQIKKLLGLGGLDDHKKIDLPYECMSKHWNRKLGFRATKAYADDRQKAPRNRRKYGRRKRK